MPDALHELPEREVWSAPAKVNLWLAVGSRRADGMHEVDTGYQAIDLADRIEIARAPEGVEVDCVVRGDLAAGVPEGEANLAARAARLLAARTGHDLRVSIVIEKRNLRRGENLSLQLAPGGGAAIRLHPAP